MVVARRGAARVGTPIPAGDDPWPDAAAVQDRGARTVIGPRPVSAGARRMHAALLLIGALVTTAGPLRSQDAAAPLDRRERAVHLLSRFSFGPRPGDVERVLAEGEAAWIERQLEGGALGPAPLRERLAALKTLGMSPAEILRETEIELPPNPTREEIEERIRRRAVPKLELVASIVLRAVDSDWQAQEVLCDFWRNHFNVSYTKSYPAELYITDYERNVVQRHALGSFPAMLRASAHHPAMLHYLDNALSRRPPTKAELAEIELKVWLETGSKERGEEAAHIAAQRGVNENYARELMELHTLGVDRTYRQKDVVAVAEAFTGWGISSGKEGAHAFAFDLGRHVQGDKQFLGHTLRKEKGPGQGERILEILARHDDTATFLATKLVRYFVNDDPPEGLVRDVAQAYEDSRGDTRRMVRTILDSEEFWQRRNYRAKYKTPNEFLISALRVTGARVSDAQHASRLLSAMGQPVYHCDDPTGWYDTADAWLAPGVMAKRWEVALLLAGDKVEGIEIPASFYGELEPGGSLLGWLRGMVDKVLPGGASTRTLTRLYDVVRDRTRDGSNPDVSEVGPEVLALLLGSPEFQEQ